MTANAPALLVAAAGVGLGHAILPDHWVPLAVLGRTQRQPLRRTARLALLAGVTHVLVSIVLGAVIIAVGLQFRSSVQSAEDTIVGAILIATGVAFTLMELTGRGHTHGPGGHSHDHDHGHAPHDHAHDRDRAHEHALHEHAGHNRHDPAAAGRRGLLKVIVPFGAAASPDLTILPVFLVATTAGAATAAGTVLVFAAVTVGAIVGLTLAAARGSYRIQGEWLERWGNALTAAVLIVIGLLVLLAII